MTVDTETPQAETRRQRRISWPWVVAISVVLFGIGVFAGGLFRPYVYTGTIIQADTPAPSMERLVFSTGENVDIGAFEDDIVLVYFGYTYCPDVCPTMLATVDDALDLMGNRADRIHTMMITVDPERDDIDAVGDYVRIFDERFRGVWGTEDDVRSVATQYGATFFSEEPDENGRYLVTHTANLLVIDRNGVLRMFFPHGTSSEDMASDLEEMLR